MKKFIGFIVDFLIGVAISIVIIVVAVGCFKVYTKVNNVIDSVKQPSYTQLSNMTVRLEHHSIDGSGWIGTGSIVKITEDYTYILTNKHVAPMGKVMWVIEGDKEYKATVLMNSEYADLSLVQVLGKIPNKVAISKIDSIYVTDRVYSVGMYKGLDFIHTQGTVAGVYEEDLGFNSIIVNMPCAGGCSGSGVFDKDGDLVAVVYAGFYNGFSSVDTAKSICIPGYIVKIFLEGIL